MPLESGTVHKQHKEAGGPRLYGIGGRERGFSFANWLPNGLPLIPAGIFAVMALIWALPVANLTGITFTTWSGLGTAALLGPPAAVTASTQIKLSNSLTISEVFSTYFRFFFLESRHFSGNKTFSPSYEHVRAWIYTPEPVDTTTNTTSTTD